MSKVCECCGRAVETEWCAYCGFVSVTALDKEGEAFNRKRVKEHKAQLINSLEKISIVAHGYHANAAGTEMEPTEQKLLTVCSGKDCLDNIVWAPYRFGHQSGNEAGVIDWKLMLSFQGGDARTVECGAIPPVTEDFWRVGVRLTPQLKLEVLFGEPNNFVTVSNELMWPMDA